MHSVQDPAPQLEQTRPYQLSIANRVTYPQLTATVGEATITRSFGDGMQLLKLINPSLCKRANCITPAPPRIYTSRCRSMKPMCGGCMAISRGIQLSRSAPQISAACVHMGWNGLRRCALLLNRVEASDHSIPYERMQPEICGTFHLDELDPPRLPCTHRT